MAEYLILYNPSANNGAGEMAASKLSDILSKDKLNFVDICEANYEELLKGLDEKVNILIAGGDGTLCRFVNDTKNFEIKNSIYYYASGNGNDFWKDIGQKNGDAPICIDKYLKNLPTVDVNGKSYLFINGIGYGIDGYCCVVGDEMKKTTDKEINYASIAIKGLLFHYKPSDAVIIVDGKEYEYKNVWLAPIMNGRFYGGGMMPTPSQDRLNNDGIVSVMVMHSRSKLKLLLAFAAMFKGEHIKRKKVVSIFSGKDITVKFSRPSPLQIDGEAIKDVSECRVYNKPIIQ